MRRIILISILFFTQQSFAKNISEPDDLIILRAIANVETNNQYWKIGRNHEKTKYQFIEKTWYQYSNIPFFFIEQYHYQEEADKVALKHINNIKVFLIARNQYSISNVGWIWNAGFGAYKRGRLPKSTKNYIRKLNREYQKLNTQK
jgi:hypothetical protein